MRNPCLFLVLVTLFAVLAGGPRLDGAETGVVERAGEARELAGKRGSSSHDLHLKGRVTWVHPARNALVLQDDSGAMRVELDRPQPALVAGQKVELVGQMTVVGGAVRYGSKALVENDGNHSLREASGRIRLEAGRHPLRLEYFQQDQAKELKVEFEGPGITRQAVPPTALSHRQEGGVESPGLDVAIYGGDWVRLPDFNRLSAATTGVATDFDLKLAGRNTQFGMVFSGWLEVPREGDYTFFVSSNDGSRLFIDEKPFVIASPDASEWPRVRSLTAGAQWSAEDDYQWAEAEGVVGTLGRDRGVWRFDLHTESGSLAVEVADRDGGPVLPLLSSRVRVRGACYGTEGPAGTRVAAGLLVPGMGEVKVQEVPLERWKQTRAVTVSEWSEQGAIPADTLVRASGRVRVSGEPERFWLEDGEQEIEVHGAQSPPPARGAKVEVLGRVSYEREKPVLRGAVYRIVPGKNAPRRVVPLLSSIRQVRIMKPEDLTTPTRVRIRGVVTCDQDAHSVTVQEAGAGITCWLEEDQSPPLEMGDRVELTGHVIRGAFAPNLMDATVVRLGKGSLPEPLRPAREQLLNGSLNARWIEVEGVVRQVVGGTLSLGSQDGSIEARVLHGGVGELAALSGAVVRVRGIVAPVFNDARQIQRTYVRVSSPLHVTVVAEAGSDPFSAPLKRVPELLQFDPAGDSMFHRVKVVGQVVYASADGCFLMDGPDGMRFTPRELGDLTAGMRVEVSGLPQLGGASPVLGDAVVRTTGRAPLPEPVRIPSGDLQMGPHDATRVRLIGTLVGVVTSQSEQVLELQRDHRSFTARLPAGAWPHPAAAGSELELTGVCAVRGGHADDDRIESFELLMTSAVDIGILSRPSWWTARRILALAGTLSLVLMLSLVWIVQLRRKVEERTTQLEKEIHQRELAEQHRAIEEERSRIARDLHDDLGARVTKITMLAEQAGSGPGGMAPGVQDIFDTSHELTRAMDEVVWTVNPRNDTLPHLAHFILHYAEKYFQGSNLRVRLKSAGELPHIPVTATVRHHLFLAVKEALHNVMKHSGASECRVELGVVDEVFQVSVADNGCGFPAGGTRAGGNGLTNMKHRLEQLGGSCELRGEPGQGATVTLRLSLGRFSQRIHEPAP